MTEATNDRHDTTVFELTDSTFAMGCECGFSGPFRPSREWAMEDAHRHLGVPDQ